MQVVRNYLLQGVLIEHGVRKGIDIVRAQAAAELHSWREHETSGRQWQSFFQRLLQ